MVEPAYFVSSYFNGANFLYHFKKGLKPPLPLLAVHSRTGHNLDNPVVPNKLSDKDLKQFKGFDYFLREKTKIDKLKKIPAVPKTTEEVRAAFMSIGIRRVYFRLKKISTSSIW